MSSRTRRPRKTNLAGYVRPGTTTEVDLELAERRRVLRRLLDCEPVPLVVRHKGDHERIEAFKARYAEAARSLGVQLIWSEIYHEDRPCLGLQVERFASNRPAPTERLGLI